MGQLESDWTSTTFRLHTEVHDCPVFFYGLFLHSLALFASYWTTCRYASIKHELGIKELRRDISVPALTACQAPEEKASLEKRWKGDSHPSEVPRDAYQVEHHIHKSSVRHHSEAGDTGCHQTSPWATSEDNLKPTSLAFHICFCTFYKGSFTAQQKVTQTREKTRFGKGSWD